MKSGLHIYQINKGEITVNIAINNKSVALFIATAITCVTSLNSLVKAQNNPKISNPEFINSENTSQFKLPGKGKPFIPSNLERSVKPNEDRGIPDGVDDRILMTSRKYPWSTIGRVQGTTANAKNYHCTGTLIYDNLVLTNSHCVIDSKTGVFSKKIRFLPNFINGKVRSLKDIASVEKVVYGTNFKSRKKDYAKDWAILVLDKPLGRKYGYQGWKYHLMFLFVIKMLSFLWDIPVISPNLIQE